ncbi:MAG: PAS domain-containing protein [Chloroflexi bacterium]|nr:PAS domain-containing protein [Chloroflexota bacterium]
MTSALDGVPAGVISLSADLRIRSANRGMGELVSRPADALVGEPLDGLLSAPSRILFQTHVYPALKADGRVEEVFLTLAAPDGPPIPVLLNAGRIDDQEEITYEGLIVRIRARARWETDLLAATRALEEERTASRRLADELSTVAADLTARHADEQRNREFRDAFIGVISHELRTPITTIYGMSHVLRQRLATMDPHVVADHLWDIEAEADRLRRLTEDLLVLSRAESRRLVIGADPIIIARLVRSAVDGERLRSPSHTFTVEVSSQLPLVLGEDVYIEQVVRNFLNNAAKYSPRGTTIRVTVGAEARGAAVRVTDEGPGLKEQDPDQLFELFYRAPDAIHSASGAGIGLFVCRELIRAMDGRVWAAPAPAGGGAEFGFWLPTAAEVDDGDD